MKFISLFAGIGGIDLGLERAGMICVAQIEKDEFCRKVLTKHWPTVPKFDDVMTFGRSSFDGPVDLITGGFPCQPHSNAGKRQASADERDLWPEYARIIREFEPRWVLAENVPGLLSSEDGRFFGKVLGDLAALRYDAEWDCIPAAIFGAPHIRRRVFLVAYPIGANVEGLDLSQPVRSNSQESRRWQFARTIDATLPADDYIEIRRNHDGVSREMDRLRALGNAVVPQVTEWIGRAIMQADQIDN